MSLKAEVQYFHRGYFDIGTINRLSDGTLIKIPYRMLTYEPTFSFHPDFLLIGLVGLVLQPLYSRPVKKIRRPDRTNGRSVGADGSATTYRTDVADPADLTHRDGVLFDISAPPAPVAARSRIT